MSEHCPQDGGFIGECGCTHPNHEHSELVKGLLDGETPPAEISVDDFDKAIDEGFYVDSPGGRVGFGKHILNDWEDGKHNPKDIENRKKRLAFAVEAVRSPDKMDDNHQGYEGRTAYVKRFEKFGVVVISDPTDHNYAVTFTYIPKRSERKKGLLDKAKASSSTAKNSTTSGRETQGGAE